MRAAVSLATMYGAEILLVHVVSFVYYDVAYANLPKAEDEARRASENRLGALATGLTAQSLRVRALVRTGKAGETIADCAREEQVDLVVVGTHGSLHGHDASHGAIAALRVDREGRDPNAPAGHRPEIGEVLNNEDLVAQQDLVDRPTASEDTAPSGGDRWHSEGRGLP